MALRVIALGSASKAGNRSANAGEVGSETRETEADGMLSSHLTGSDNIRLYTEQSLLRKMKRELARLPDAVTEGLPDFVYEYLLDQYVAAVCDGAGLRGLRRKVFSLHLRGYRRADIAFQLGVSRQLVAMSILFARRQVGRAKPDKYAGLHEVYWREVHRYIYRKPRRVW